MKFATIRNHTHAPGAPAGWNPERDGHCGALPIRVEQHGEGNSIACKSAWRPSPEELATLQRGGFIELTVVGWQVPVALNVINKDGAL